MCKLSDLKFALDRLNEDLAAVAEWCRLNKLKIDATKTKAMIFGSAFNINLINLDDLPKLVLDDVSIDYVVSFKYLGVVLDQRLMWSSQVAKVCNSASRTLYRLRHAIKDLNVNLKLQLVTSLVLPVFDYCAVALTNLNRGLDHKLTVAVNNCVRYVLRKPLGDHISGHRLDLGWLSPYYRRLYLLGCVYYGMLVLNKNTLLYDRVRLNHNIARHRDNNRTDTLIAPIPRTTMFQHSFLVLGTSLWNSLPPDITTSASLEAFRTKCFNHFMEIERANVRRV